MKKSYMFFAIAVAMGMSAALADDDHFDWKKVVDNNDNPPGLNAEKYFSYNQPSVNNQGLVAFRARAKLPTGSQGGSEPTRGVFSRNPLSQSVISVIASNKSPNDIVPPPNNVIHPGLASFNEFPAFPRIDKYTNTIAFRGQSQPSWEDPILGKLGGTTGIYAKVFNRLRTGIRNLEIAANFPQYWVPSVALSSAIEPVRFDQFPGAPAISELKRITFKGNYSDGGTSKTGIFYRTDLATNNPVTAVAWTGLAIPDKTGQPTAAVFGSTAPPSTANSQVVFAGFDNEENPTAGGLFHDRLGVSPSQLKALVSIGAAVPGAGGATFTRFGEALSFDGRYVSFWGAWLTSQVIGGDGWKAIPLTCPVDGNADVIKACVDGSDDGLGHYTLYEPVNQGIFVLDRVTGRTRMIAKTGGGLHFDNFLFWSFTGAPPGAGGGDEGSTDDREPPRWRSSAFAAVNGRNVVFKAKKSDGSNGIYMRRNFTTTTKVIDTNDKAGILDSDTAITVTSKDGTVKTFPLSDYSIATVGLERDGFRNNRLAISVSMGLIDPDDPAVTYSWAGIYLGQWDEDDD